MKKFSTDHKSNLNTSCTSDIYSLMSGSLCSDGSLSQSLAKISELKRLYSDICFQQENLQKQNLQLINELECVKKRVQEMIQENFGWTKKKQTKNPCFQKQSPKFSKKFKPGSIAKIKKNNQKRGNVESYQKMSKESFQEKQSILDYQKEENTIQDIGSKFQIQKIKCKSHKKYISSFNNSKKSSFIEEINVKTSNDIESQNQIPKIRSYLSPRKGNTVIINRNTNN